MSKTTGKAKASVAGEQALIAALDAQPEATVTELAAQAGLGRSTVSGLLARLEHAGQAKRQEGGRDGARRLPDRWSRSGRRKRGAQSAAEKTARERARRVGQSARRTGRSAFKRRAAGGGVA